MLQKQKAEPSRRNKIKGRGAIYRGIFALKQKAIS